MLGRFAVYLEAEEWARFGMRRIGAAEADGLTISSSTPIGGRKLAVVCDGFEPAACFLAQILQEEGFDTLSVSDGLHVMQILRNWIVDLLVIDILMPSLDGLETIGRIQTTKQATNVVAVSGGPYEYLAMARMMGASMTFSKPVPTSALREYARGLNVAAGGAADDQVCWEVLS